VALQTCLFHLLNGWVDSNVFIYDGWFLSKHQGIHGYHYSQHNDAQHNDAQHNDAQYNDAQHNDAQHNGIKHNNKLLIC
jgi:hypothetical protein